MVEMEFMAGGWAVVVVVVVVLVMEVVVMEVALGSSGTVDNTARRSRVPIPSPVEFVLFSTMFPCVPLACSALLLPHHKKKNMQVTTCPSPRRGHRTWSQSPGTSM